MPLTELWQRRILRVLVITPWFALAVFVLLAVFATSGWSSRLVAIGLAFEIAGVLAVLNRTTAEELELRMVWNEARRWTLPGYWAASILLPVGFVLQFISVAYL